jgi:cobalamin biosynthesis Mg chelatase CobN
MFLVPKNLLLNLTTFSLNLTTPTAHDSYAFSSDYNVYWLHNVSVNSNYEWWDRLDFNSQDDSYQLYNNVTDDLQCPDSPWTQK